MTFVSVIPTQDLKWLIVLLLAGERRAAKLRCAWRVMAGASGARKLSLADMQEGSISVNVVASPVGDRIELTAGIRSIMATNTACSCSCIYETYAWPQSPQSRVVA